MKFFLIIPLAAVFLPVSVQAQQTTNTSVCLRDTPPGVLLNICEHARGSMVTMPQPTLYLRIYKDGRGEYETSTNEEILVKKEFRINAEDISKIAKLCAAEGVQKALERYPAYNHGRDSSREITVDIYTEAGRKRIILTNFFAADRENKDYYPASLISLMKKVEEIRSPANGIVTQPFELTSIHGVCANSASGGKKRNQNSGVRSQQADEFRFGVATPLGRVHREGQRER